MLEVLIVGMLSQNGKEFKGMIENRLALEGLFGDFNNRFPVSQ